MSIFHISSFLCLTTLFNTPEFNLRPQYLWWRWRLVTSDQAELSIRPKQKNLCTTAMEYNPYVSKGKNNSILRILLFLIYWYEWLLKDSKYHLKNAEGFNKKLLKDSKYSLKKLLFWKTAYVRNPLQIDPSAAEISWSGDCPEIRLDTGLKYKKITYRYVNKLFIHIALVLKKIPFIWIQRVLEGSVADSSPWAQPVSSVPNIHMKLKGYWTSIWWWTGLTHLPQVPHICVNELVQHWFR